MAKLANFLKSTKPNQSFGFPIFLKSCLKPEVGKGLCPVPGRSERTARPETTERTEMVERTDTTEGTDKTKQTEEVEDIQLAVGGRILRMFSWQF